MTFRSSALMSIRGWVFTCMAAALSPDLQAQCGAMRESLGGVSLSIEVSRSTYRPGDSINLRLTLRNTSERPIPFLVVPAPALADLCVSDAAGQRVEPELAEAGALALSAGLLKPGAELTLRSAKGEEWVNLRDWGYELRTSGTYIIQGMSLVGDAGLASEPTPSQSNRASINIEG